MYSSAWESSLPLYCLDSSSEKSSDGAQRLPQIVGCHGSELLKIQIRSSQRFFGAAPQRHILQSQKDRARGFVFARHAAAI